MINNLIIYNAYRPWPNQAPKSEYSSLIVYMTFPLFQPGALPDATTKTRGG